APLVRPWDPPLVRLVAQPLILEVRKPHQIGEALYFCGGVPAGPSGPVEPERRAGLRREVPLHDLADMGIELFGWLLGGWGYLGFCGHRYLTMQNTSPGRPPHARSSLRLPWKELLLVCDEGMGLLA